jgi:transposase
MEEHHRFLLSVQLHRLWAVEKDLGFVEQRIQEKLKPYAAEITLWMRSNEIPGVDATLAAAIIAEMGVGMTVFENVSQLASWAGVCPGNNESAGKRRSSRIPKGNVNLKTALVKCREFVLAQKGNSVLQPNFTASTRRLKTMWGSI